MTTVSNDGQDATVDMQTDSPTIKAGCGEIVDISTVRTLHGILREALESGASVEIDASSVERIDAAGMQLLCAFVKDATTYGTRVRWVGPTQAFVDTARLLRVNDQLQLPKSGPAQGAAFPE